MNKILKFILIILVINVIPALDFMVRLFSILCVIGKSTGLVEPQPVVPLPVFFTGDLSIFGRGIKAEVS